MLKKVFSIFLLVAPIVFAQARAFDNGTADNSSETNFTEEDLMLLQMIMTNDLFRATFVQACTVESIEWLGATWADKTCSCAYDNLAKNQKLLLRFLKESETDNENEMDQLSFELMEQCLPQNFPTEMESAIIRECMTGGMNKSSCDCVVRGIKNKYTVRTFMKNVFASPAALEQDMTDIALRCNN